MIKRKTLQLHPSTQQNDINVLIKRAEGFLSKGHQVCFICKFKGRENAYPEHGEKQLTKIVEMLSEVSLIQSGISKKGSNMTLYLIPK